MKRKLVMAVFLALALCAVGTAWAGEVKSRGEIHFSYGWSDNTDFMDNSHEGSQEDDFFADQVVYHYLDFITSEDLKMTLGFKYDGFWGNTMDRGADDNVFKLKRASLQWVMPNTDLQLHMGFSALALPAAVFSNPIFNDEVPNISASYKFSDAVSATAFWARLYDNQYGSVASEAQSDSKSDEEDLLGLVLPVSLDGVSFAPYLAYATIGKDVATTDAMPAASTTEDSTAWWIGTPITISAFEPFEFLADVQYGALKSDDDANEASGWRVDATLAYKMDFMTPRVLFNYGSGDDAEAGDGSEMMPWFDTATDWGISSFGTEASWASTATFTDGILPYGRGQSGTGMWALGLELADISLLDGLSQAVRVVYYQGTTDESLAGANFTEKDSAVEFNLDSSYQIYDNLGAVVELGWMKVDADKNVAGRGGSDPYPDDAWKLHFYLDYQF